MKGSKEDFTQEIIDLAKAEKIRLNYGGSEPAVYTDELAVFHASRLLIQTRDTQAMEIFKTHDLNFVGPAIDTPVAQYSRSLNRIDGKQLLDYLGDHNFMEIVRANRKQKLETQQRTF